MGLTDREAYLDLRARYIRLVAALRSTRNHNPATLEAIERILQSENTEESPYIPLPRWQENGSEQLKHHVAA